MHNVYSTIVLLAIGVATGLVIDWGETKVRGKVRTVPYIGRSARNTTIAAVVLILVAVSSSVSGFAAERRNTECYRQFFDALDYNTMITAQQRQLDADREVLKADARKVNRDLYAEIVTAPPETVFTVIDEASDKADRIEAEIGKLNERGKELDTTRKAYPEPTCGRA